MTKRMELPLKIWIKGTVINVKALLLIIEIFALHSCLFYITTVLHCFTLLTVKCHTYVRRIRGVAAFSLDIMRIIKKVMLKGLE